MPHSSASGLIKRYFPLFGLPFIITLTMVACEAACDLLQPTIMARVIDEGIARGRIDLVMFDALLMLGLTLIGALFASTRNILASRVSQSCAARIRADLYRHIIARSIEEASGQNPDSLLTRLTNDITQVQNFLNGSMRIFFKAPILAIGAIVMAVLLDPGLSLVLGLVLPLVIGVLVFSLGRGFPLFQRVQEGFDRLNTVLSEFLAGHRVVKAFDRGPSEIQRFDRVAGNLAQSNTRALQIMARVGPLVGFIVNLGIVAVLWLGYAGVANGSFHPGHLIAFSNYMTQILFALLMAATIINGMVRARVSAARIAEQFDRDSTQVPGYPVLRAAAGLAIECQGLDFQYKGRSGAYLLKDLSFTIQKGEFIGIIGSTGCGKSTLLGLICGFNQATNGSLRLGNPEGQISLVPQQANLFSGTIRSNLLWGNPHASQSQLAEAAAAASALEFIQAFPEGWDTVVGRGGVTLSGGQKQRLAIARALLRQGDVLILDDATSAVDTITEAAIRHSLRGLVPRPTILMVAQRLGSVAQADRILVLDEGRIAGFDTFQRLSKDCAVFREIIVSQTGLEADHV